MSVLKYDNNAEQSYLDKAVVQAEVVSYAVLPTLTIDPVEGKLIHDVTINSAQGETTSRR